MVADIKVITGIVIVLFIWLEWDISKMRSRIDDLETRIDDLET